MTTPPAPSVTDSLRRLGAAQKSNKGAPLYSVLVNRPMGRLFAALAHQVGLTPNQITLISAVFTFGGIALLAIASPTWPTAIAVALALTIGYGLDAADGQLARLRGGGSLFGEWLDHVVDSFKIATLHTATAVMIYRFYDVDPLVLLLPLGFGAVYVVHFFGMLLTDLLTRVHYAGNSQDLPPKGAPSTVISLLKLPTDYGLLCWVYILIPLPMAFLFGYGLLAVGTAGYTLLVLFRWARSMARLDSAR